LAALATTRPRRGAAACCTRRSTATAAERDAIMVSDAIDRDVEVLAAASWCRSTWVCVRASGGAFWCGAIWL
jgi:hypothetical protein